MQGCREVFEVQGQNEMRPLVPVIEVSRWGRKQGNLAELNLEALLEPCCALTPHFSENIVV